MLSTYLLFASLVLCYGQISEVEEILELTQSNFELAKGRHENLFVEFCKFFHDINEAQLIS